MQSSYTWSKAEDTTQNSTFFSRLDDGHDVGDAGVHSRLQQGSRRTSMPSTTGSSNFVWQLPSTTGSVRRCAASTAGRSSGIVRMRSGNPLTPFVQTNRSRSLWAPSLGPGTGPDRPSYAPGRGAADAVTGDPDALVRSGGVRAAACRHVRQRRTQRAHRTGSPDARPGDHPRLPGWRARPARRVSSCVSRSSICSIARTSGRRRSWRSAAPPTTKRRSRAFRPDPNDGDVRRVRCNWACGSRSTRSH